MTRPIAFVDLKAQQHRLKLALDEAIARVLAHGRFIMGPEVQEFEAALATASGAAHAVSCASGTDALIIALMGENIGRGDAVFLPAFTFTATAEVVTLLGALPIFVDIDAASYLIDLADLEAKIAACAKRGDVRPRAIIAVDLFGQPADYDALEGLAEDHDMFLIADAAQSCGARFKDRPVGSLAAATAFSFFPAKPLGCYGDGGALVTDDDARAEVYKSIRAHGKGGSKYEIVRPGLNSRLDTLQAAILLAKLPALASEIVNRENLAQAYDNAFGALSNVEIPIRHNDRCSAWAQYTVQLSDRDRVAALLREQGIPTAIYYPLPMHLQPAYLHFGDGPGSLPVSERLSDHVLSLPMHPDMPGHDAERITDAVRAAVAT
jgi:dTDP-4-amino-4,6-dideoxygalactose transaminase